MRTEYPEILQSILAVMVLRWVIDNKDAIRRVLEQVEPTPTYEQMLDNLLGVFDGRTH